MLSPKEKEIIVDRAKKYSIGKVILFGAGLTSTTPADYDLGVLDILPEDFFKFYADLIKMLSLPVDLVDLSHDSSFTRFIMDNSEVIYEKAS